MTNKWLFFDCFGVLIDSFVKEGSNFSLSDGQIEEIQEKVFHKTDRAAISDADAIAALTKIVGVPGEQFIQEIFAEKATLNTKLINWIKQNSNTYHMAMLSNAAPLYLDPILKQHDLQSLFEKFFISSDLRITKPDPAIYKQALRASGCKPEDAIMIDDREDNIRSARNVGMHSIVFKNTNDVIAQIKTLFP